MNPYDLKGYLKGEIFIGGDLVFFNDLRQVTQRYLPTLNDDHRSQLVIFARNSLRGIKSSAPAYIEDALGVPRPETNKINPVERILLMALVKIRIFTEEKADIFEPETVINHAKIVNVPEELALIYSGLVKVCAGLRLAKPSASNLLYPQETFSEARTRSKQFLHLRPPLEKIDFPIQSPAALGGIQNIVNYLSAAISLQGASYHRPNVASHETFTSIYKIKYPALAMWLYRHHPGVTVKRLVVEAERLATNGTSTL